MKHRRGKHRPFIVWEGRRDGEAHGYSYRRRWQAIVAAWWASHYTAHEVWIEREMPQTVTVDISAHVPTELRP
jgi:hypothetical protein